MGFSANFYLVTYYVSYLVRLLVGSVLDQFVNARKVAYLRRLSGFATLLIRLLPSLLIVNKKSPVIRRGCSCTPLLLSLPALSYHTDLYIFPCVLIAIFRTACDR